MRGDFVHLHVHTQFSTLDSALRIKDLLKKASGMGMPAVAITDHANMFGAIQLYKYAKDFNIKPILGCEINVVREGRAGASSPVDHLVLLASSEEGYHNLVRVVSRGHTHPASNLAPSVRLDTVAQYARGLVCLTACMGGVLQQRVLEEGTEAGLTVLDRLREIFEPGHLFVEIQDHGLPEQPVVNGILADLARRLDLPLVGSNDCHFQEREDGEAQLYLQCIRTGRSIEDVRASHHGSFEMFLKSGEEMRVALRDYPEACTNTLRVAEMCTGWKLKLGHSMLPKFPLPEGFDEAGYFCHIAREGLEQRFKEFERLGKEVDRQAYRDRLEVELQVICKMQFPGYFLIVWDFIRYAKEHGIPVGPGRGSGAGSLVAYALRITDLDPLPFHLLFERFLNPERVSMPDFDVDFCMDKRDRVLNYVAEKYGRTSVGQIATFHELKARSVIKDVARAMQFPAAEAARIAALIPMKGPGATYTLPEMIEQNIEPKFTALLAENPQVNEMVQQARLLEGLTRHAGMHAAGVVISEGPLWDHVPVFVNGTVGPDGPAPDAVLVTQYYKEDVELAGLVKFDFLGLKTLTVLDIAVQLVNGRPDFQGKPPFDPSAIPLDDRATYDLLGSGETVGVFQLESSGMQKLFQDLKPTRFEDIVAAVALYRPGPLETGMVKDFVECKHGRQPIKKMHPLIDDLLEPTYGVIVYQEQVMQIAQKLAGYTLGGADLLRRAMGKKKPDEMAKQKSIFVEGAVKNGVDASEASNIFDLVEKFAGYGFNKSHSAAYALITYQTAYLKAHYPVEFFCALMTADKDKNEKVVRMIAEARSWEVKVLPPDINESNTGFKVVYGSPRGDYKPEPRARIKDPFRPMIRFGLGAIRGVGEAALDAIFEARSSGGPFRDLFDFASRVDARRLNRGVLEALVFCGAFDSTFPKGVSRAQAFRAIDGALDHARHASRDRERGQTNLFSLLEDSPVAASSASYPTSPPWDLRELLRNEKDSLGFYVSGHPLDRYGKDMERFGVVSIASLSHREDWAAVKVAGIVENYKEKIPKGTKSKIAFFDLEDTSGRIGVKVRDKELARFGDLLVRGEPLLISGKLSFPPVAEDAEEGDTGPREPTLLINDVQLLVEAIRANTRKMILRLPGDRVRREQLAQVRQLLQGYPAGTCIVQIVVEVSGGEATLTLPTRATPSDEVLAGLERIFGERRVELH
ncbi:MAG: DNA polymerase III subunit alpha [Myxococcales bacterium]|nr:DNA polymerase III subunit alpha [Polyangiaceae bacterium]MDW8250080.1 DNA polymerase III subunit alpha [Myxococcales bacterium]